MQQTPPPPPRPMDRTIFENEDERLLILANIVDRYCMLGRFLQKMCEQNRSGQGLHARIGNTLHSLQSLEQAIAQMADDSMVAHMEIERLRKKLTQERKERKSA